MYDRVERQNAILARLKDGQGPVRGEDLADLLGVTRQVVVHDIALMRAGGLAILSTPRGYFLEAEQPVWPRTILSVRHRPEQTQQELYALVDHGIIVDNVIVEHPVYGEIIGNLRLKSRYDVDHFLQQMASGQAMLLSQLTQGYHLHTVRSDDNESLLAAKRALVQAGIAVFD